MKWLFNRKRRNSVMITVWQKLSLAINRKAHTWADYLNGKAAIWSPRKVKMALVLFGGVWMAGSAFVAWHSIQNKQKPYSVIGIAVPRHVEQRVEITDSAVVHAVNRIEHFKSWLDSLHQRGSPVYDSITQARPGLLDSILFIEQYYSRKK
jgi:hypothetical protein